MYRDIQRDEAQMVVDELVDIQTDMAASAHSQLPPAMPLTDAGLSDPAVNSPRRAAWLADEAAEAERRRQLLSRRDFFGGGGPKADE
jgi:hypothetical protein